MATDEKNYDVRTIERYLREGKIDRDEYEEHLENLPDVSDKAQKFEAEFEEGVLDDEDEEQQEEDAETTEEDDE